MARYRTVDSLRGGAAMAVVFYHLSGNLKVELGSWMPEFVMTLFSYGYLGVPVFFVISGFVISQSVAGSQVNFKYVGNFALRRAVRLDPPYWASIVIAMVLLGLKNATQNLQEPYPEFSVMVAHMFYLQDLLRMPAVISEVYWTLCMEVQLYLFFIITMALCLKLSVIEQGGKQIHLVLMLIIGFLSLLDDYKIYNLGMRGLFLPYWHYFFLGVLLSRVIRKDRGGHLIFISWVCLELIFLFFIQLEPYSIAAIFCSLFLYVCCLSGRMDSWLVNRPLLFLGKISYCLYLLHPDIGWKFISLGKIIFGQDMQWYESLSIFSGGIIASVLAAYLLFRLVEKPSLAWASRLKK